MNLCGLPGMCGNFPLVHSCEMYVRFQPVYVITSSVLHSPGSTGFFSQSFIISHYHLYFFDSADIIADNASIFVFYNTFNQVSTLLLGCYVVICERFKKIRLSLGKSQPDMSVCVGISRNVWQTYELGKSTPGTQVYQALLAMGFSVNWLISGVGEMRIEDEGRNLSEYSFLPLYSCVGDMGPGREAGDDEIVDWIAYKNEWLQMELKTSARNLALIIAEGDSMLPTISPGDTLVVDHSRRQLSVDGVYVLNLFGNCLVKRIQVLMDGSVKIISDNAAYASQVVRNGDLEGLHVAGRVVWHGKRL